MSKNKLQWEVIEDTDDTYIERARVAGGWIVRARVWTDDPYSKSVALTFVFDAECEWLPEENA